jgi:sigma-B regulation protein RsbU (phosphoserine phosphatase)
MRFKEHEFELHPGDSLFVYTDGVAEATDIHEELFGNDRMLTALNENPAADPETLLHTVREHVDRFVGDAPQFDDLTMLSLLYKGSEEKNNG